MTERETIEDHNAQVLDHIETMSDGKQQAMDPNSTIVGSQDPKRNVTQDVYFRTIGPGNTLVEVLNG